MRHHMDVGRSSDADVYEKHAASLTRFASGLVGPSDAQDVVSSAVLRAMASPSWRSVENHQAYLYRSVVNEARMHHRSTMRRLARERRHSEADIVFQPEVRPEVLAAVGRLSTRQRAVVFLAYWEDLTPAEIGARLGIGEGSVKRHLARARDRLRRWLPDD